MVQNRSDPVAHSRFGAFCYEDYEVGQKFKSRGRTVTDADIRLYLGATGTDHPIHTDEEFCRNHSILKGVCAPGVLVLAIVDGFLAELITRHMASVMNYGHDKIRYLLPVYLRDTVHAEFQVVECRHKDTTWGLVKFDARAINQNGACVLFNSQVLLVQRAQ
jgi:acyl dehydratase